MTLPDLPLVRDPDPAKQAMYDEREAMAREIEGRYLDAGDLPGGAQRELDALLARLRTDPNATLQRQRIACMLHLTGPEWDTEDRIRKEIAGLLEDPEYRPGPPSAKQAKAHETRGGWWMAATRDPLLLKGFEHITAEDITERRLFTWMHSAWWRPCLPDGTACPWPA